MKKTKIEWCDSSWNPVTGCFHDCEYCYARRIANRFGMVYSPKLGDPGMEGASKYDSTEGLDTLLELEKPYSNSKGIQPYPYRFYPTLHRYRLEEPTKHLKRRNIFVCSMADLFGDWVPDQWITDVFSACEAAPQHNYLFLTKNPARFRSLRTSGILNGTDNMWFGVSATNQQQLNNMALEMQWMPKNSFLSLEPLHGPINLNKVEPAGQDAFLDFTSGRRYWLMGGDENGIRLKWIIIGAETGNRKGKIAPKRQWIENVVNQAKTAQIPIFMKNSIKPIWGDNIITEFPYLQNSW